jgi:hypothetical protein
MRIVLHPAWLAFVVGTRAALAFGAGLLIAEHIPDEKRKTVALALVATGVISTVPAAMAVFGHRVKDAELNPMPAPAH